MVWRRAILVSALLAAGCGSLVNYHADGVSLLQAGRLTEAWAAFERGYEQDPRSPYSLNNMGLVLEMRDGDLVGAAEHYRKAIQACLAYPDDASLHRLEKMARDNLQRVHYKLQMTPMHRIDWGLGIGDWGLGTGDWGLGIGDWVRIADRSGAEMPQQAGMLGNR
jgi:tetratricopeptide (TPR) repeat protein